MDTQKSLKEIKGAAKRCATDLQMLLEKYRNELWAIDWPTAAYTFTEQECLELDMIVRSLTRLESAQNLLTTAAGK